MSDDQNNKNNTEKTVNIAKSTKTVKKKPTKAKKPSEIKSADIKIYGMPTVCVRDLTIFPGTIVSLFIGRKMSVNAVNAVINGARKMVFVTQKDSDIDDVDAENLYNVGVLGNILQCIVLPDDTIKLLVDASHRVQVNHYYITDYITCDGEIVESKNLPDDKSEAYNRILMNLYKEYLSFNSSKIPEDSIKNIVAAGNISKSVDLFVSYLNIEESKKTHFLQELNLEKRIEDAIRAISREISILKEEREFQSRLKGHMDKNHKNYYLHEQLKIIKKELGDSDDVDEIVENYEQMIHENKNLSKEAVEKIRSELSKLKNTSSSSSEFGVIKSYLDTIFELPWKKFTKDEGDLVEAEKKLSESHYGMEKAKDRIIEHIAVQYNINKPSGVVICLHGAPGVGKTTFAKAIAKAMNREYVKISLGGLHDPSELFGHRKTYIGAMAGKIINAMKKAKVSNPLILLDEIDKMSSDYRGDPASVMLEILDPEQNKEFTDHYLDIGYDISNVFFIATANSLNFSQPLRDRMELINIPSYLEREKIIIAKDYLIPSKFKEAGLDSELVKFEDEAINYILNKYTREAGVRELERCIAKIARKTVVSLMRSGKNNATSEEFALDGEVKSQKKSKKKKENGNSLNHGMIVINKDKIREFLGVEKFSHSELESESMTGVVNGLAYTSVGGDVLLIEAVLIENGKGEVKFTGSLGDVMKESIQMSFSYIKANLSKFGITKDISKFDIHIHAPEGATPKDGPSAGVTICTAIVSLLSDKKVRKDVAMTGEVTLRGKVLAIGGLREKLTSAVRSGQITEVAIPKANIKDLEDIPVEIIEKLKINACEDVEDVLRIAFVDGFGDKKAPNKVVKVKSDQKKENIAEKKSDLEKRTDNTDGESSLF